MKLDTVFVGCALSLAIGCGGGEMPAGDQGDGLSSGETDAALEISDTSVILPGDQAPESMDAGAEDCPSEVFTFTPCSTPEECLTGICTLSGDGKQYCAPSCIGEPCPAGWKCVQVQNVGGDSVVACMPAQEYLCRPCKVSDDCKPKGVLTGDLCIEFGPEGRFCGRDCGSGQSCPEGFECAGVSPAGGGTAKQCRPSSGKCECMAEFVTGGYETWCFVENVLGRCEGTRKCAAEGMTPCTASTPAFEECNGIDDDCDGETDEETVSGECEKTFGSFTCKGKKVCEGGLPACQAADPTSEKCGDSIDNDCNGETDEEGAENCTKFYRDQDGDSFGTAEYKCLCGGAGEFTAQVAGDCDDKEPAASPAAAESCDGLDNDCDGQTDEEGATGCATWYFDGDGDSAGDSSKAACLCGVSGQYSAKDGGDCNDADAAVHPGATETCGGKDDDCDGSTDPEGTQGCSTYFLDADGDGYGVAGDSKCLCGQSGGYSAQGAGDCDDGDKNVHPGASESCNGHDDDCDGIADEEGAGGCQTLYLDQDGDGYGQTGASKCLCKPAGNHTAAQGGDCNDGSNAVHPGAAEVCNGQDDNCDGLSDPEGAGGCGVLFLDSDGDGWGVADGKCLCKATGSYSAGKTGDCNDSDGSIYPSAPETCDGKDNNCNGPVDDGSTCQSEFMTCFKGKCHWPPDFCIKPAVYNGHLYAFCVGMGYGWNSARVRCQNWGGDLIVFEDGVEHSVATANMPANPYWVGASRTITPDGSWAWVTPSTYGPFCPGKPDNKPDELCAAANANPATGCFDDLNCDTVLAFICEKAN